MGRFEGEVAIVRGSGSGIGRAIAARFAAEGAVCVADIDLPPARRVASDDASWITGTVLAVDGGLLAGDAPMVEDIFGAASEAIAPLDSGSATI